MGKVTVTADKNKNVISVSANPEYGNIRLTQKTLQIDEKGWLKSVTRSTLLHGKIEDLQEAGYREGTELPGKIIVVESLTPLNDKDPDRDLKIAGNTGVVCRVDDQPIYRQSYYSNNPEAYDVLISHTNREEIRDVMAAQKELSNIQDNVEEINF
jgi:hypothetical protein